MRLLEFLLILVLSALLAGAGFYALRERAAAERATASALAQAGAQDVAAADRVQAQCADEVRASLGAGEAIARLSAPHARSSPTIQPMFSAADIRSAMQ